MKEERQEQNAATLMNLATVLLTIMLMEAGHNAHEAVGLHSFPHELVEMILFHATQSPTQSSTHSLNHKFGSATLIVCRFVCHQWKLALPLPPQPLSGQEFAAVVAGEGHLSLLQWARANHCSWYARVCEQAALGGHLELLKWAREHGCKWYSMEMPVMAARHESPEMLK